MRLSILSGVVPFVLWSVTATSLKPEHVRNSKREVTIWGTISIVLVQIALWILVFFFVLPVISHLPGFLITGWRLPLTSFVAACVRWFALLMVFQYVWLVLRATLLTALYTFSSSFRERDTIRKLERILKEGGEQQRVERLL